MVVTRSRWFSALAVFGRTPAPARRRRGVGRREVFSAQFDGGQRASAFCTSILLSCDVLERRLVLASAESDFVFSQATITGYKGLGGVVDIPSIIGGVPVAVIGENAFARNAAITSVSIPDSVVFVGTSAFDGDTALTSVKIGKGVLAIGNSAFSGNTALPSVKIPGTVKTMGDFAFSGNTALTQLTIGAGVQTIGNYAFAGNTSLKDVKIPGSVKIIGDSAFRGNTALKHLTIAKGVQTIGDSAFERCRALWGVKLPDSVTKLGAGAFYGNTGLHAADVGNGLAVLAPEVFAQCTALRAVVIGKRVTAIEAGVFAGDHVLSWIEFLGSPLPTIHPTAFSGGAPGAIAHLPVQPILPVIGEILIPEVDTPGFLEETQQDIDNSIDRGFWAQKTNVKRPGTGDN